MKTGDLAITDAVNRTSFFTGRVVDGWVELEAPYITIQYNTLMIVVSSFQSTFSGSSFSLVIAENCEVGWIADARLRSLA